MAGLIAWEVAARLGWITALFFPPPTLILLTLRRLAVDTSFWSTLGITLLRFSAGVGIGAGLGLLLGWTMGTVRALRRTLEPIIALLHPLPKLALFPLLLVLLGIGEASKVASVALAAFFPMVINTLAGVQQIEADYWAVAANYGVKGGLLLRRVIVPGSLPLALVGLRLAVNQGLMLTVAVEMLAAQQGLGAQIWLAWQTLRLQELYAILAVISLVGFTSHRLLNLLTRWLLPWQASAQENE